MPAKVRIYFETQMLKTKDFQKNIWKLCRNFYIFASANEGGDINNVFENKENHALSQSPDDATEDVALCAYHYVVPVRGWSLSDRVFFDFLETRQR